MTQNEVSRTKKWRGQRTRKSQRVYCTSAHKLKNRYRVEDDAEAVRKQLNLSSRNKNIELRVYECRSCNGFHLTSKPETTPGDDRP